MANSFKVLCYYASYQKVRSQSVETTQRRTAEEIARRSYWVNIMEPWVNINDNEDKPNKRVCYAG